MKYVNIALRNLNRKKGRSFMLAGAIAFGMLIITAANGFTGGMVETLKYNISQLMAGHMYLVGETKRESGTVVSVINDDQVIFEALEESGIKYESISRRSMFMGEMLFGGETISQMIYGVNWGQEEDFAKNLVLSGNSTIADTVSVTNGLVMNERMAERLKVELGEQITVKMSTATGQRNVGTFILTGLMPDSGFLSSIAAYANIEYVNTLLNLDPHAYQAFHITLENMDLTDQSAEILFAALNERTAMAPREEEEPQGLDFGVVFVDEETEEEEWAGSRFSLQTVNDELAGFNSLVDGANTIAFVFLIFLFVIIMVGLANTFRRILYERVKEIGTMRSIGMQRSSVRKIFLYEALFLSIGGSLLGVVLANLVMFGFSIPDFGTAGDMAIFLREGHLFFRTNFEQVLFNMTSIGILTLMAVFFPVNKAARMNPADALRQ